MDHSLHFHRPSTRPHIKKSINSKSKAKKSPGIHFSSKQIRSRSQSKTVAKHYPPKDNSFCKPSNKRHFPQYSSRTIWIRSRTPNLGRIKSGKKGNHSRYPKKSEKGGKKTRGFGGMSIQDTNDLYFLGGLEKEGGFGKRSEGMQKSNHTVAEG